MQPAELAVLAAMLTLPWGMDAQALSGSHPVHSPQKKQLNG